MKSNSLIVFSPDKRQAWNEVMDGLMTEQKRILQARAFKGCSRTLLRLKLQQTEEIKK